MKKTIFALALTALAASAGAQTDKAGDKAAAAKANLPGPVAVAVAGGLKLENTFKAPGGLTGWVLSSGVDQNLVVYTPADGSIAIAGNMLDAKGVNLTKEHLAKYAPQPDYEKLWSEASKSTWIAEGAKGADVKSTIYVFEDANCSFCHLAWKAFQPYQKVGLQVRWIPVAFLSKTSYDKAAATLAAKDPGAAFTERHKNFTSQAAVPEANAEMRAKIEANNKLMSTWGFRGTPAIIYKDKDGTVRTQPGMVTLSQLPQMTGLPAQPNNDPDLARFR